MFCSQKEKKKKKTQEHLAGPGAAQDGLSFPLIIH